MYKDINETTILKLDGNIFIPKNVISNEYLEYLKWVEEGNTIEPADIPPIMPISVSMKQARLALHELGYLTTLDALIANAPESVKIEWEYSSSIDENHPTVQAIKAQLGWSDQTLHSIFVLAQTK